MVGAMIDFVYKGSVCIAPDIEQLFSLGKLADRLDIASLRRAVVDRAQELLTIDTCATFLQASRFSGLPELEERLMRLLDLRALLVQKCKD